MWTPNTPNKRVTELHTANVEVMNQVLLATAVAVVVGAVVAVGALRLARAKVYDALIVRLTTGWYAEVLYRLPKRSKLLDVGIGTGTALANNRDLLVSKGISVEGVDYDADYVDKCRALIAERELKDRVSVRHASIYDFKGGPYDGAYFSSSLMIMPDPVAALRHAASMLNAGGYIYVTQTIQTQRSKVVEVGKPLLKYLTTIDFGTVTYESDLLATFKKAGLTVTENVAISGSTMDSTRSFRLFTLKP